MPVLEIQSDGVADISDKDGFSFRLMARDIALIYGGLCPSWISGDVCRIIREIIQGLRGKLIVYKLIGLSVSRIEKTVCDSIEVYCDRTVKFVCNENGRKKHLMTTLSIC